MTGGSFGRKKAIRGQAVGFEEGHADARCVRAQAGEAEGLLAQVGRLRCACGVRPIPAMRCWAHILTHVWMQVWSVCRRQKLFFEAANTALTRIRIGLNVQPRKIPEGALLFSNRSFCGAEKERNTFHLHPSQPLRPFHAERLL